MYLLKNDDFSMLNANIHWFRLSFSDALPNDTLIYSISIYKVKYDQPLRAESWEILGQGK